MPPMEKPPMAPDVQAQTSPGFGSAIGQAQSQAGKSPIELAVATVEKILTGIQDEAFRPYATKAIASLKIGLSMSQSKQPQSGMMLPPNGGPPPPGGGLPPSGPQMPSIPGNMPG